MHGFARRSLIEPGFVRRLLNLPETENAYIELENLLATRAWDQIGVADVANSLACHGVKTLDRQRARALYRQALGTFLAENQLATAESPALGRLRFLLAITDGEAETAKQEIVTCHWQRAVDDRRISPDEEQSLAALAKVLDVEVEVDAKTKAQLDRYRWYWLVEHGTFPEIHVALNLQRGEICHFAADATMHEIRTETHRTISSGPSMRIRIMKGVSYRVGSTTRERIARDVMRQVDAGTLYVTNKRVIFDGRQKNTIVRLSDILSISPYADGIEISKTSGRNPIFIVADAKWLAILLSGVLAHCS